MWFPDDGFADYEYKLLDPALCEKVYRLTESCPLQTAAEAKAVMAANFPARETADFWERG